MALDIIHKSKGPDFLLKEAEALTEAQKGQARANIGAGLMAGFRNKIINGGFDVWQRGVSQTGFSPYGADDRWQNIQSGSTRTVGRLTFLPGQIPAPATYYCRTTVASVAGADNLVNKTQRIESVRTLAGKRATLTFWARGYDGANEMAFDLYQFFGTGGTPSAVVGGLGSNKFSLTNTWQKFSYIIDIPSIAGKTIGTNNDDALAVRFWFDAGSTYNSASQSLGHQSGIFDLAWISLVEGDATAEVDPFSSRHIQQELALCQWYFAAGIFACSGYAQNATQANFQNLSLPQTMRVAPTGTISNRSNEVNVSQIVWNSESASQIRINVTGAAVGAFRTMFNWTADAEL